MRTTAEERDYQHSETKEDKVYHTTRIHGSNAS